MRYIVAIAAALLVLLLLAATTGFGDWPRPWGPLSRGALGGAIAIGVLIVWEQLYPREDSLTDEERERIALEDSQGVAVVNTVPEDSAASPRSASSAQAAAADVGDETDGEVAEGKERGDDGTTLAEADGSGSGPVDEPGRSDGDVRSSLDEEGPRA